MEEFKNEAIISGKIVNKFVTPKATLITLQTSSASGTRNYPRLVSFKNVAQQINDNFEVGDHVRVNGCLQSKKRIIDGKPVYSQSVFVDSIEEETKLLEDGNEYPQPENSIIISGTISSIFTPREGMIQLILRNEKKYGNRVRFSYINVVYFTDKCGEVLESIHRGDFVNIAAEIQTKKKVSENEAIYFENLVAKDIVKG